MAVYLELIAEDLDDIGGWLGAAVASSNAQVELLPDGDMYVSIDFRVDQPQPPRQAMTLRWTDTVNDETGEGHPRPLIEVLADPAALRREELEQLRSFRDAVARVIEPGDEKGLAALARVDERLALLHGLDDLPEPDADELLPPD